MSKFSLIIGSLLFLCTPLKAQVDTLWTRFYDGTEHGYDTARIIAVDKIGNVYVTGNCESDSQRDVVTIKYSPNGNLVWSQLYGASGDSNYVYDMQIDQSGNIYIAGNHFHNLNHYCFLIKYYSYGDTAWIRTYDGGNFERDCAYDINIINSNEIIMVGSSTENDSSGDALIIKYLANGDIAWARTLGSLSGRYDFALNSASDPYSNIYVAGGSSLSESQFFWRIIKLNIQGDSIWTRTFGRSQPGHNSLMAAKKIRLDPCGNIIVVGDYAHNINDNTCVVKYSPDGDSIWSRIYDGGVIFTILAGMEIDENCNIYISGYSNNISVNIDYFTIKYLPNGDTAWIRIFNAPGNEKDYTRAMAIDDESNIYVTGQSEINQDHQFATVKYNTDGQEMWVQYEGTQIRWDKPMDMVVDQTGNIYITGSASHLGCIDYLTIKYRQWADNSTDDVGQPLHFSLQAYPNPFNPSTNISFTLPSALEVRLEIYDILGRRVRVLADQRFEAGEHTIIWDGANQSGAEAPSGVYFYRLLGKGIDEARKMVLLR